jgi:hypothetical protein
MPTQSIEWDAIVRKIRRGKSILILGPGVYRHENGATLQSEFINELDLPNNPYIQNYYREDDFFLFRAGGGRGFTIDRMERFYEERQPDELLRKIARLPFKVILNITPDHLLRRAFDAEGFHYQFDHYKKLHEPGVIQQPSQELPLLYNLLGSVEDEESLLMTHNDLYDYFKSIFSRKSMPDKLKLALRERKINCFIFLGVPFEKWYMQLLLRELEIHRGQEDFIRYAANVGLDDEIQTFCTEQFTIQFVENDSTQFVNELYTRCEAGGYLRPRGQETPWEGLREMVANARLDEALPRFMELAKGTELESEVNGLHARHRRFARKVTNGVLDSRDIPVQEAQITAATLDLITEAETL